MSETPTPPQSVRRFHVDLSSQAVRFEEVPCEDLEDVLGGIARSIKFLAGRDVPEPYAPEAPLMMWGGVALNPAVREMLAGALGMEAVLPSEPQLMGAYGAALLALEDY